MYRYLLGVGGYATIVALRGEIGASKIETRLMETTLHYIEKIKTYQEHDMETESGEWMRTANKYRTELNMTCQEIKTEDRRSLRRRLRDWNTQKWQE